MKTWHKAALVAAGYIFAIGVAYIVTGIYVAMTEGPDRDLYSGMYAFGDALLFLGTFSVASVPTTCTAFYFLRPNQTFWKVLAVAGVANALIGAVFAAFYVVPNQGFLHTVAPLRMIVAAGFSLFFWLACAFSPKGRLRLTLGAVAAVEAASVALFFALVAASR